MSKLTIKGDTYFYVEVEFNDKSTAIHRCQGEAILKLLSPNERVLQPFDVDDQVMYGYPLSGIKSFQIYLETETEGEDGE